MMTRGGRFDVNRRRILKALREALEPRAGIPRGESPVEANTRRPVTPTDYNQQSMSRVLKDAQKLADDNGGVLPTNYPAMLPYAPQGRYGPEVEEVNTSILTFREPEQFNLAEVRRLFPEGEGYFPIVTSDNAILDGHNRTRVAIERGDTIPRIEVPGEIYRRLKSLGFDETHISHFVLESAGHSDAASGIRKKFRGANFFRSDDAIEAALTSSPTPGPAPLPGNSGRLDPEDPEGIFSPASRPPGQTPGALGGIAGLGVAFNSVFGDDRGR